jgi:multidrug transporter EmrE-like cation transporter
MKALDFLWVLSGVLLNAVAQLLLKAGANSAGEISMSAGAPALMRTAFGLAQNPSILGGLGCYAISVVVWIIALSRVEVSIAYPMLSIGYVVNAMLAWWLFGEDVNLQRWLGIGVIIVGVILVARSGSTA